MGPRDRLCYLLGVARDIGLLLSNPDDREGSQSVYRRKFYLERHQVYGHLDNLLVLKPESETEPPPWVAVHGRADRGHGNDDGE